MNEQVSPAMLAAAAVGALADAEDWLDANSRQADNTQSSVAGPKTIAEVPAERAFYEVLVPLGAAARSAVQAVNPALVLPDQFVHATRIANDVMVGKASGSYMARQSVDLAMRMLKRQFEELGFMQTVPA